MTKLLVDVKSFDDLTSKQINNVDIWSIPYELTLSDAFQLFVSKEKAELSIAITNSKQLLHMTTMQHPIWSNIDYLSISLCENHLLEDLQNLQQLSDQISLVASISIEQAKNADLLNHIVSAGFNVIELRPANDKINLLKQIDIASIEKLISHIREYHINISFSGGLEAPDIPRLLPFSPYWLGFNAQNLSLCDESTKLIRALIPNEEKYLNTDVPFLGTDRILVSDFIVPMEIGAYAHEIGHKQRVRFNIAADIERLTKNPEDMSHIFSYDLIMDGIRRLVGLGHVELVETLAERIASFLLAYPRVKHVIVRVEKLDLGPGAVGIEIERYK